MNPRLKAPLVFALSLVVGAFLLQSLQPDRTQTNVVGDAQAITPPSSTEPQRGHVYTGVAEEPSDLNPFTTTSAVARRYVLAFTHDTLLDADPQTFATRPALAESFEVAADGMSMTVRIRDGVTFSDGAPLTIEDVLWTHEVARADGVVLGSLCDGMRRVASVARTGGDPRALRIGFDAPHFAAARTVGESWVVVQKAWMQKALADLAARDGAPEPKPDQKGFGAWLARLTQTPGPGTGPYQVLPADGERPSWRRGIDLTVYENLTSWRRRERGVWNFEGIRVRFLLDPAARFAALKKGELDWHTGPDLQALLENDAALRSQCVRLVYDTPSLGAYVVQWNVRSGPLADARVRRALGMRFDRTGIASKLFAGAARASAAFCKPDSGDAPDDLAPLPFDAAASRALLRDAGFDGATTRLSLRLLVPVEAPWFRRMGELFASACADVGVDVQLDALAFRELVQRRDAGDFDGAMLLLSMPALGDVYEIFHSKGARNAGGFADAELDALLEQQRTELDASARRALLRRVHARLAELQPCALVVHPLAEVLVDARLQGVVPGPLGLWPERMWMPLAAQRR